ncbi:MAG TPA: chorismate mutase [Pyrinomonadaceae bacterium]|nr:chorismate mutase [Pyrinomonadaceae bacterium]
MSIDDWRVEIDEIDEQIISLLNTRAKFAVKIGELKMAEGLAVCDVGREQMVIKRMLEANRGPLDEQAIIKIFRRIIRESRRTQTQVFNTTSQAI